MKTWALVVDTWREAYARYTLLGFAAISALFLFVLTFSLNLDIVDGTLAAGTLFGKSLELGPTAPAIDTVVDSGLAVFAAMLYGLGVFLAVFATGSQVPHLVRRGTVDLYLTRPIARVHVLLGRFVGAVSLVVVNLAFLCGGVFLIVALKTGVWQPRFFAATGVILLVFLSFLGFMYLIGVLSGSTPLSIMLPYALYLLAMPLAAHDRIAALVDSRLAAWTVHGLYWVLPKTAELGRDTVGLVLGRSAPSATSLWTTAAFGVVCLILALIRFEKKSF